MPARVNLLLSRRHFLASLFLLLCALRMSMALSLDRNTMSRQRFARQIASSVAMTLSLAWMSPLVAEAFSVPYSVGGSHTWELRSSASESVAGVTNGFTNDATSAGTVAYRSLSLPIDEFGVEVPIACWFPVSSRDKASSIGGDAAVPRSSGRLMMEYPLLSKQTSSSSSSTFYQHRISVKRIGQLLAGWDFIPDFVSRDFRLEPTLASTVTNGQDMPLPSKAPVVFLAHGYLGSRFDLSHLAEELARQGFVCVSPEYPESLAASYPRMEGLNRGVITKRLLDTLSSEWNLKATSYGIVGHSLGCGTAVSTGDSKWARVLIAGFPRQQDGSSIPGTVLFLSSMNDGAVSLARFGGINSIPADYVKLDESTLWSTSSRLPSRAALVFNRPDGPNHISFLAGGVNDAMIDLLSPLLPLAQALKIPVLDFDRYKDSRDSRQTADIVIPLVTNYLKQHML